LSHPKKTTPPRQPPTAGFFVVARQKGVVEWETPHRTKIKMQTSWRLTLRVIAILILLVAVIWLAVRPGFDALIGLLIGCAMLGSLAGGGWVWLGEV
jgi:hypothetical protein